MYCCSGKEDGMMDEQLRTIVFLGSVREGRLGLRVAKFVKRRLETINHSVQIFDPLEMPFPVITKPLHYYSDRSDAPAWLVDADKNLQAADAVVVVASEYNHSIPPALSNMMNHFPPSSYAFKPSGIVCYSLGPYGGMRAAMQLRAYLDALGCSSVCNIFGIPAVNQALDEDGKPLDEKLIPAAKKLVDQLDWHAHAMRNHRLSHGIPE